MNLEKENSSRQVIHKDQEIYCKWTTTVCFFQPSNALILAKFTRTNNEWTRQMSKYQTNCHKMLVSHFGLINNKQSLKRAYKVLVQISFLENKDGKKYLNWLQTNLQKSVTTVLKRFALS